MEYDIHNPRGSLASVTFCAKCMSHDLQFVHTPTGHKIKCTNCGHIHNLDEEVKNIAEYRQ